MRAALVLAILATVALAQEAEECPEVKAMDGFKYSQFTGRWYEIGHYRNEGSKVWSENCVCSTSDVIEDLLGFEQGDSIYTYDCNLDSTDGEIQLYDALLSGMNPAGKWQLMHLLGPFLPHDFTVVSMTAHYALVYRCGDYAEAGISYTAQILSRKPTLDAETIQKLKAQVTELNLNPENAEYGTIAHNNCTYEAPTRQPFHI